MGMRGTRKRRERERAETSIVEEEREGAIQRRGTSAVMKHLLKSDESVKGLGGGRGPGKIAPFCFTVGFWGREYGRQIQPQTQEKLLESITTFKSVFNTIQRKLTEACESVNFDPVLKKKERNHDGTDKLTNSLN
ncbi:hypothetical protein AVEN_178801-1 [Araneus ventricosus]|uniref:Uncharacterized protein n=1 Tax=Araneus ventricosus TaxID=182803 RepID=A0A4Y2BDK4_ARAVE|nr:hypothetical protein AVEN_178801-1 [Araneus ventricosus]